MVYFVQHREVKHIGGHTCSLPFWTKSGRCGAKRNPGVHHRHCWGLLGSRHRVVLWGVQANKGKLMGSLSYRDLRAVDERRTIIECRLHSDLPALEAIAQAWPENVADRGKLCLSLKWTKDCIDTAQVGTFTLHDSHSLSNYLESITTACWSRRFRQHYEARHLTVLLQQVWSSLDASRSSSIIVETALLVVDIVLYFVRLRLCCASFLIPSS